MKKMLCTFLILVIFEGSCLIGFQFTNAQSENSWKQKAPMHNPRYAAGVAVANETIYVIGGRHTQTIGNGFTTVATNSTEAYNPSSNSWTDKSPMQMPLYSFGVAVYQNRIFAIGESSNFVYDPKTDTWTSKAPMPIARMYLQANFVNGKIYLIGGETQNEASNVNEAYDPATDSWTTCASIPIGVEAYSSTVVNNKIYIISGYTGNVASPSSSNLNQVYDPTKDTWKQAAPIPNSACSSAAGSTTGTNGTKKAIYVINGANSTNPLDAQSINQVYFPQNDSWTQAAAMPVDRAGLGVAVINNTLYAIGGGHNIFMPDTTDNWQYIPPGYETNLPLNQSSATSTSSPPLAFPNLSSSPNTNPSTSVIEFPTWIVLPSLFLITSFFLVLRRRRHMTAR